MSEQTKTGSASPAEAQPGPTGDVLDRVAVALQKRREPGSCVSRLLRLVGLTHLVIQLGYVIFLVGVMVVLTGMGERNLTAGTLLYAPMHLWLVPLLLLFPVCLCTPHRWVCWLQLGVALYLLGPYMGWRMAHPMQGTATGPVLRVLTNNRGQNNKQSMREFIEASNPDVMLFQEQRGRDQAYLQSYPQFKYAESAVEYSIVSKHPVLERQLIWLGQGEEGNIEDGGKVGASRVVIDWSGRKVAIYNVHLETPRGFLRSMAGPAILYGVMPVLPGKLAKKRDARMGYFNRKLQMTKDLRAMLEKEKLPYLVVGDFNMPHEGYLYRLFRGTSGGLRDAHREAGQGWGFTAIGSSRNPLTLRGPWIRIDYIFASPQWHVRKCVTEPDRASQHRAVTAELTLE